MSDIWAVVKQARKRHVRQGVSEETQNPPVILSVSEGSRVAVHRVLFTGFFVAALRRMTGGRERAVGDAGPYNYVGSPAVSM